MNHRNSIIKKSNNKVNKSNKMIDNSKTSKEENQELIVSLNFLEKTKSGEYANIGNKIDVYSRINAETIELEEYYFTSFS